MTSARKIMTSSRFFSSVTLFSYFIISFASELYGQNWKTLYDKTWSEDSSYTIVRKNNRSGLVETKTGNLVIPVKYKLIDRISDSVYRIADERYRGYISPKGYWLVPMKYDLLWFEFPDRAIVQKNGMYGVVDFKGNLVIPIKYLQLDRASEQHFIARTDRYCGVIDRNGETLIPFKYEDIRMAERGTFPAKLGGKWGLVDWSDKVVIPFEWGYVNSFSDDMASVLKLKKDGTTGLYGFINRNNQLVIDFQYSLTYDFKNGRAFVILSNGKSAYIDKSGKILEPSR
jgi:WG containing repeat